MAIPFLIAAAQTGRQPAYAGGYRPSGRHKAASAALSASAAGLVGLGLATALVAPQLLPTFVDPGIDVVQIPVANPPDPPRTPPSTTAPPTSGITTVPPLIQITTGGPVIDFVPPRFDPPAPYAGPVEGPTSEPPLVFTPVRRAASRNNRFLSAFQPPYPAARQREQIEGSCRVSVSISAAGRVTAVRPVTCADDAFYRATERQALRSWRFNPATLDGAPIASELEQNVIFRIDED